MHDTDIVFVLPGKSEAELDQLRSLDVDRDWRTFKEGISSWILQTYLRLSTSEENIVLSGTFHKQAINIAHVASLVSLKRPKGCFVVGVRADYPEVRWCNLHIVQNQKQIGQRAIWLPHWPQPGLVPRDKSRGVRIQRVGYFGRSINHYSRVFRRASGYLRVKTHAQHICQKLGIDLVERGPEAWNDFGDVDVVLGIRAFSNRTFDTKPPTKLINAWLAQVPFIGGADSAYAQIGSPGRNYLRATKPSDMEEHLVSLRDTPGLSDKIQRLAAIKASEYTIHSVHTRWCTVLNDIARSV